MTVAETPDHGGAFRRLNEAQLATLLRQGKVRDVARGAVLFRAGEVADTFLVVASAVGEGAMAVRFVHELRGS